MALRVDFTHPLRSFDASRRADGRARARRSRSSGRRARARRRCCGSSRDLLRPRRGLVAVDGETCARHGRGASTSRPSGAASATSSRSTRSSRISTCPRTSASARASGATSTTLLERFRIAHLAQARVARALGRRAPAGRARARARARPRGAPARRAALGARRAHDAPRSAPSSASSSASSSLPTILVTHDFEDAAALADRVGVIVDGRVLQVGTRRRPRRACLATRSSRASPARRLLLGHRARRSGRPDRGRARRRPIGVEQPTSATGRVTSPSIRGRSPLGRSQHDDSAVNHVRAPITSIVPLGNRARVRVGPLVAEVTHRVRRAARPPRGRAGRRVVQGDGRAAAAARIA